MTKMMPFFMFTGNASEAIDFYVSTFSNAAIVRKSYHEEGEMKGKVMQAVFSINGQNIMCIDSPCVHAFTFTPSLSLYISFSSGEELERVFNALAVGGGVLMPLDAYPFSKKYGWVTDKFGVSWQLDLEPSS